MYFYTMEKFTNSLITEHSLYLQQHAHNPVNWVSWSVEAFEEAKRTNKLVLVSIGYSACHWCHVMEHECFEDEEVAALMNKFFICIKVDREERPDVDQVYMTAVQLMTQRGGWPLNCFTLPDGKPIYGGTYFPKEQWMHILKSLQHTYTSQPEKVVEYAMELTNGVAKSERIAEATPVTPFSSTTLHELVRRWESKMDRIEGGSTYAPKFPLPTNYRFLLHYGACYDHDTVNTQVKLTLHKMAFGGIYDQLGGGFSRYSVDMLWKIPHFEKMLYDNGQLLELYANAFYYQPEPEYLRVMENTLRWLENEMMSEEGGLFAAQDADSEGEEGKYYVWSQDELKSCLNDRYNWFSALFNPQNKGYWEHNNWVLLRNETWESFLTNQPELSHHTIQQALDDLLATRKHRIAPGTDMKCLTAWNAMTISGLTAAYSATDDSSFLHMALKIGRWIVQFQLTSSSKLWHTRQNKTSFITGFLDDYTFTIAAFISLYQVTFDNEWLQLALKLIQQAQAEFLDKESGMYFFAPTSTELIARKMELTDNVIPGTNSVMGHNLLTLSHLTDNYNFELEAKQLLQNMLNGMENHGSDYSNWALLLLRFDQGVTCITVPREKVTAAIRSLISPFTCIRFTDETYFTICKNGRCSLPIQTEQALIQSLNSRVF
jgi:uncharacterized protein YyaL (SSP411 family)